MPFRRVVLELVFLRTIDPMATWLRHWIFRAPVLGIGTALLIAAGAYQVTRPTPLPQGRSLDAACAWHGRDVVLTGVVHNFGSSSADFQVTPTFWLRGLGVRGVNAATFVHVPAGEVRAWIWVDPYTSPRHAGTRIRRCGPTVQTVPRPSGDD
jgi:hypothetical protein